MYFGFVKIIENLTQVRINLRNFKQQQLLIDVLELYIVRGGLVVERALVNSIVTCSSTPVRDGRSFAISKSDVAKYKGLKQRAL